MPRAIRIEQHGGPEVMQWVEVPMPEPAAGQVRLRHTAIGVNFVDVYNRAGLYKGATLPFTPGAEAAGVVDKLGEGVDVAEGRRPGRLSRAAVRLLCRLWPASSRPTALVKLPDGIDDRTAAAGFLKGVTVEYLLLRTFKVGPQHTVLFHAAAGGVGTIAGQWLKALGATVDRHGRLGREGGARPRSWLRSRHQLRDGELRRPRRGDHRRREMRCRL